MAWKESCGPTRQEVDRPRRDRRERDRDRHSYSRTLHNRPNHGSVFPPGCPSGLSRTREYGWHWSRSHGGNDHRRFQRQRYRKSRREMNTTPTRTPGCTWEATRAATPPPSSPAQLLAAANLVLDPPELFINSLEFCPKR